MKNLYKKLFLLFVCANLFTINNSFSEVLTDTLKTKNSMRQTSNITIVPTKIEGRFNLSENPIDTLSKVLIGNFGSEPYSADTIYISPTSGLYVNTKTLSLLQNEEKYIYILVDKKTIKGKDYNAKLYLKRRLPNGGWNINSAEISYKIKKADIYLPQRSLNFSKTAAQDTSIEVFEIKNLNGNVPLQIDSLAFASGKSSFKIIRYANKIYPKGRIYVQVKFSPRREGLITDLLYIYSNAYPNKKISLALSGIGTGGTIDTSTINKLKNISKEEFETFTNNLKEFTIKNSGQGVLKYRIDFSEKNFGLADPTNYAHSILPGSSIKLKIKYNTPNFESSNTDTMKIYHNSFIKNPLIFLLKGSFDKEVSVTIIKKNLFFNNEALTDNIYAIPENISAYFKVQPEILEPFNNIKNRIVYYTGGNGTKQIATSNGRFGSKIDKDIINNKGLILYSELCTTDKKGVVTDSIRITENIDIQVLLEKYKTQKIFVPRSIPNKSSEAAATRWVFFGFPFEEVMVDSVFNLLGGREKMEDGKWIIYSYSQTDKNPFEIYDKYYFTAGSAYFTAQAIADTFNIVYKYKGYEKSRKLSDNSIYVTPNKWNAISSPYTFAVQVEDAVNLYEYKPYSGSYKITNIMKPGIGYFVKTNSNSIEFKTYGKFASKNLPFGIDKIGWHKKITVSGKNYSKEFLLSLSKEKEIKKTGEEQLLYKSPPEFFNDINVNLTDSKGNKNLLASIGDNIEGEIWDLELSSKTVQVINIKKETVGKPYYNCEIKFYDNNNHIINNEITLQPNSIKKIKIVLGNKNYIKNFEENLENTIPSDFTLLQNYPNPFNPLTVIGYSIPHINKTSSVNVKIRVYNMLGKLVKVLSDKNHEKGRYSISFDASDLPSGVYIYRLEAYNKTISKKMILLK